MKIAYISPYPPEIHGVADYTHDFLAEMSKYIDDFIVVSNKYNAFRSQFSNVFRVLDRKNPMTLLKARKLIENFDPDLVHIEVSFDFFWPWLPVLVNILNHPLVVTAHEVQIDRERLYADQTTSIRRIVEPVIKNCVLAYERKIYRNASRIIVHEPLSRRRLLKNYGITAKKITVLPHGVNCSVVPKKNYTPKNAILFFGAIMPHKGFDILLKAFERIHTKRPELNLIVIGGMPALFRKKRWISDLKRQVAESNIHRNVKFLGVIEDFELIAEFFRECDVIALPYRQVSASSVLAYAQAYGVPIVASRVGGFIYLIQDGETGLLIEPDSVDELECALLKLLDDETLRRKIGRNARAYAQRELWWKHICRKTYELYSACVHVLPEPLPIGIGT